jgi:hypothetical protein
VSTWGQLRFQLQAGSPGGVSLDLIDEWLNGRYTAVLQSNAWQGAKAHATIATTAAYRSTTDSATFTVGSASVTGAGGTNWLVARIGQKMYRPGDTATYTVTAVGGVAALTLDRAYEGNGEAVGTAFAGSAYVFMQNIYALPADCRSVVTILNPSTGLPLDEYTQDGLNASAGARTLVGDPAAFAVADDSAETSPPVLHQVELYPPPLTARGFALEYIRDAAVWDGSSTNKSPLPWVTDQVLLQGVRADMATYLAGQAAAAGQLGAAQAHLATAGRYQSMYQAELQRILRVEHQERLGAQRFSMAPRFTRHRLARGTRGQRTWGPGQGGPN